MSSLDIRNLAVSVEGKKILIDVSLVVRPGEIHAVMGPNGSGKSTLAYAVMGHPHYKVQSEKLKVKSKILLENKDITYLSTEERAKRGLFLALQSPIAIPGVSAVNLLRSAYQEIHGTNGHIRTKVANPALARRWKATDLTLAEFTDKLKDTAKMLSIDESFLTRGIHEGFSGGEKKKAEILQALILRPKYAIFDEIDTGLDVDALKIVALAIKALAKHGTGVILITHYQRILKYLSVDWVHVLVGGIIAKSGRARLADKIEREGYKNYE